LRIQNSDEAGCAATSSDDSDSEDSEGPNNSSNEEPVAEPLENEIVAEDHMLDEVIGNSLLEDPQAEDTSLSNACNPPNPVSEPALAPTGSKSVAAEPITYIESDDESGLEVMAASSSSSSSGYKKLEDQLQHLMQIMQRTRVNQLHANMCFEGFHMCYQFQA
jgi:hypothetical protein